MSSLLNITPYVLVERYGQVKSFPNDYTLSIFKKALTFLPDAKNLPNSALVVHRERNAIYYIFITRIGRERDEIFGLCVVTTNLMFTRLAPVFTNFEETYRHCYQNKIVIGERPCGIIILEDAYKTDPQSPEQSFDDVLGEKICSALVKSFENFPYTDRIPPVVLSEEADTSRTYFGFVNPTILAESCKLGYVVIRKSVMYTSYVDRMMPAWKSDFKKCSSARMLRAYLEKYGNERYNPYNDKAHDLLKPKPTTKDKAKKTAKIVGYVVMAIGILIGVGAVVYCIDQVRNNKTDDPIVIIVGLVGMIAMVVGFFKND